jgi:hypothetical protein
VLQLYKVLIGCKPLGRHTEQHDVYFGIADNIQNLIPQLVSFWPQAEASMHVDAITILQQVNGFDITIVPKQEIVQEHKLFFINLGGYKPDEFDEYHYRYVTIAPDKASAIAQAKQTAFYKHTGFKGAPSHIDDKYGIDVDDAYAIEEVLSVSNTEAYSIVLTQSPTHKANILHLGYFTLPKLKQGIIIPE